MLPFLLPLWETDATLRAAVEQSAQASVTSAGSGAALLGADLAFDARAASPRAVYLAAVHAAYAHAFEVALAGGADPPSYNLSADAALSADWTLSPRATLSLDTDASLATTYGIHADTQLLALDPFLFAQRLEYAVGPTLTWSFDPTARSGVYLEGGYLQTGALASEAIPGPLGLAGNDAVGVDTHEAHASLSTSYALGARDALTPEIRADYAHYYHALLDLHFHRGPADLRTGTLSLAASHEIAPGFTIRVTAGASLGDAMPAVHADHPVLAPDAALLVRWAGRRARITARAAYDYTSLGPRIGFGQELSGTLTVDVRPRDGVRFRDLLVHGKLRFAHGSAPIGADPQPVLPGMPLLPATGLVTTTTLVAGTKVEIPLVRGLAFTTGGETAFARGATAAGAAGGQVAAEGLVTLTVGLAATVSTDRRRTVPHDPEAEQEEEGRRAPGVEEGDEREEAPR